MKRNLALILIAALLITPRFASADAVIGTDVSAFASTSVITGNAVSGSVFAASDVTVLHYFSTFCDNLIPEIQYMQRAYIEYAGAVNVLGLLYEDSLSTAEDAKALFEEYELSYDCIHIDEVLSPIVNHYNYIPQTFIVSRDGIIIEHFPGMLPDYNTLEEMLLNWVDGPTTFLDVTFIDGLTNEIIEVQQVAYGADAVLPLPPVHEGYEFSYWEGDYTGITAPAEIIAVYEPLPTTVPSPSPEPTPSPSPEPTPSPSPKPTPSPSPEPTPSPSPEPTPSPSPEPTPSPSPEPTPSPSPEPTPLPSPIPQYIPGDADGNGSVEIVDAVLVLRYAMGIYENEIIPLCCELSGDGTVTVGDAILVLRLAMGLA